MLPLPLQDHIPESLKEALANDPSGQALVTFLDALLAELKTETQMLEWLRDPERCPPQFLAPLSEKFGADIRAVDLDDTKRRKIKSAIRRLRNRGEWARDVKLRIDAITGMDSFLYTTNKDDDDIMLGDGIDEATDWGCWGGDGLVPFGMAMSGDAFDGVSAGIIYIATDDTPAAAALTPDVVLSIVDEIRHIVPAYYIIYVGYVDTFNVFHTYPDGTI